MTFMEAMKYVSEHAEYEARPTTGNIRKDVAVRLVGSRQFYWYRDGAPWSHHMPSPEQLFGPWLVSVINDDKPAQKHAASIETRWPKTSLEF